MVKFDALEAHFKIICNFQDLMKMGKTVSFETFDALGVSQLAQPALDEKLCWLIAIGMCLMILSQQLS